MDQTTPNYTKCHVVFRDAAGETQKTTLFLQPLLIGRGDDAKIWLRCSHISRKHAHIHINAKGEILLRDLKSSNGTYVNNKQLEPLQDVIIQVNDHISFGSIHLTVVSIDPIEYLSNADDVAHHDHAAAIEFDTDDPALRIPSSEKATADAPIIAPQPQTVPTNNDVAETHSDDFLNDELDIENTKLALENIQKPSLSPEHNTPLPADDPSDAAYPVAENTPPPQDASAHSSIIGIRANDDFASDDHAHNKDKVEEEIVKSGELNLEDILDDSLLDSDGSDSAIMDLSDDFLLDES